MSELLTAAQAAGILGMSESGVYKLVTRGHLPRRANGRRDPNARGIVDRIDVEQLAAVRLREHATEQQRRAQVREVAQEAVRSARALDRASSTSASPTRRPTATSSRTSTSVCAAVLTGGTACSRCSSGSPSPKPAH